MQKICAIIAILTGVVANTKSLPQAKWSRQMADSEKEATGESRQFSFGEWIPLSKPFLDPLQVGRDNEDIGLTPPRPPVTRQIRGDGIFYSHDDSAILSVPPPPPGGIPTRAVAGSKFTNFQNPTTIQNLATFGGPLPLPTQQSFLQPSQIQFVPRPFATDQNLAINSDRGILPETQSVPFVQANSGGPQFVQNGNIPKFESNFSQQKFNKEQNARPSVANFPSEPPLQQTLPETFVQQQPVVRHQQTATFEKTILTPPPVSNATAQNVDDFGKEEIQLLYVPVQTLKQRGTYLQQQQQQRQRLQSLNQQHQSLNQQQQSLVQQQQSLNQQDQQKTQQQQALNQQNQSLKQQQLSLNQQLQSLKQQQQSLNQQKDQQQTFNQLQRDQLRPVLEQQQQLINRQREQKTQQQVLIDQQHEQQTRQQLLLNQQQEQQLQQQDLLNQRQQQLNAQQKQLQQSIEFQSRPIIDPRPGSSIGPTEPTTRTGKISPRVPFSPVSTASTIFFQTLPFQVAPHSFVSATPVSSTPATFENSPIFTQKLFTPTPETTLSHLSTLQNTIPNSQSKNQFATTPKAAVTEESLPEEIITGRPQFQNQKFNDQSFDFVFHRPQQQGSIQHQSFVTEQPNQKDKGYAIGQQGSGLGTGTGKPEQQWHDRQQFTLEKTQDKLNFLQQKKEKELREQYLLKQLQQEELEKERLAEQQRQKELAEQRLLEKQERQKKLEEQRRKEFEEQKRQKEIEEERLLQLQRQKEAELEEQRKLQKLKEAEEIRLALEKEKQKEKPLLRWQKQQIKLENQRLLQQQQQQQQKDFEGDSSVQEQQNEKQRVLQQQQQQQQQRQNNFENQNYFQQEQNEKRLEEQRASQQQRQNYYEGQNSFKEQQREKQLEDQRVLQQQRQQQRQNNFDVQNSFQQVQNEKRLEGQRASQQQRENYREGQDEFQQRQKEKQLEDQRVFQRQRQQQRQNNFDGENSFRQEQNEKRLEGERASHQQRQQNQQNDYNEQRLTKEQRSEDQRVLQQQRQQQRQNNFEEHNSFQQEQNEKELERQRALQQQRQNYNEGQNSFEQQRKEKQQQLAQQSHQTDVEEQRELKEQQTEEQRELKEQQTEEQRRLKQEHLEERQRLFRQQQLQKQKDENYRNLQKFYQPQSSGQSDDYFFPVTGKVNSQTETEKKPETESLIPHQPPLSVFYKGNDKSKSRILDVLRHLKNSKTITVLDQYFETMPKVFVGPAALTEPEGYDKFDLPYLSNIETNVVIKKIDNLPFFVAPLNFVPPSGYSKIPFPSPHVGSVVVSDESNPSVTDKPTGTEINSSAEEDAKYSIVGPELPGLINRLETGKTTVKSTTTSLPQTTAQWRNRRPSSNLFRGRKPVSRTRSTTTTTTTTTIKPEEVTRQSQREEDGVFGRPYNRFVKRRRQPVKLTTERSVKRQPEKEAIQNRHYSVQVNYQSRNNLPTAKQYTQIAGRNRNGNEAYDGIGSSPFSLERPKNDDGDNFETYEEGPLPTGSSKTITLELYRPTDQGLTDDRESVKFQASKGENAAEMSKQVSEEDAKSPGEKSTETGSNVTAATESETEQTPEGPTRKYPNPTDYPEADGSQTTAETIDNVALNNAYTAAFAEISKSYHIPRPKGSTEKYEKKYSEVNPLLELSRELETPLPESSQEFSGIGNAKSTQALNYSTEFPPSATYTVEDHSASASDPPKNRQSSNEYSSDSEINPNGQFSDGYLAKTETALQSATNAPKQQATESDNRDDSEITRQHFQHFSSSTENPTAEYEGTTKKGENDDAFADNRENHSQATTGRDSKEADDELSGSKSSETQRTDDRRQDVDRETLANNRRQKFSSPSNFRARTRVRSKQRGQIDYATHQSSNNEPTEKLTPENEDDDQETSTNSYKNERHRVKSSKYNFRVATKPSRQTAETTTENDQKQHVYTIRPHRRPTASSTLSTKRIRRPTTPSPTEQTSDETFPTSAPDVYPETDEESKFPTSAVSNDVYHENGRLSNGRTNFRKTYKASASPRRKFHQSYDTEEENNDFPSTSKPPTAPYPTVETYHSAPDEYRPDGNDEDNAKPGQPGYPKETVAQEYFEVYPQWRRHPEIDSTGTVLTTTFRPEGRVGSEEERRFQESKKALDADPGKKNGRRRIRVRVHKRPHENFETAESQNLRTVANVLVQPTSTYKPSEENQFRLAKNSEPSQKRGEEKIFQLRSKNYFETRFNLSRHEIEQTLQHQGSVGKIISENGEESHRKDGDNGRAGPEIDSDYGSHQRNEKHFTTFDSSGKNFLDVDGRKVSRTKLKGYVRKVIKHRIPVRKGDERSNQPSENGNADGILPPEGVWHQGVFNQTKRLNGTRHKTIIRYIKKNKVRNHDVDGQKKPEDTESRGRTEIFDNQQISEESVSQANKQQQQEQQQQQQHAVTEEESKIEPNSHSVYATTAEPELGQTEESILSETKPLSTNETPDPTESTVAFTTENDLQTEFTVIPSTEESATGTDSAKPFPVSRETSHEPEVTQTTKSIEISTVKTDDGRLPYRPRFHQRPPYHRPSYSGFNRAKLTVSPSTTESYESEQTEKRFRPSKSKYGKFTPYVSNPETKIEEPNRENNFGRQKANGHYNFDVRKYSSNRNREGGPSQFTRSRHATSGKTEIPTTASEEKTELQTSKTTTTPTIETTTSKPETDATANYSTAEIDLETTREFGETTPNDEEETEFFFTATQEPEFVTFEPEDGTDSNHDVTTTEIFETAETTETSIATEPIASGFKTTNDSPATTKIYSSRFETTHDLPGTTKFRASGFETTRYSPTTAAQQTSGFKTTHDLPGSTTQQTSGQATTEDFPETQTETARVTNVAESTENSSPETEATESYNPDTQPDLYRFAKNSFSFDESENFAGTQNRAYVRNITADIIESTSSFSAPGIEQRNEIRDENFSAATTETDSDTEASRETSSELKVATNRPETEATTPISLTSAAGETKISKSVKTSTATKISHETEICFRGKCIRTKSENPGDEELKLLVDSASVSGLEKNKT